MLTRAGEFEELTNDNLIKEKDKRIKVLENAFMDIRRILDCNSPYAMHTSSIYGIKRIISVVIK